MFDGEVAKCRADFPLKDKYGFDDLVKVMRVLRGPADALGMHSRPMSRSGKISLRRHMKRLKPLTPQIRCFCRRNWATFCCR